MALSFAVARNFRAALLVWTLVLSMVAGMTSPAPADTAGQVSTRNIILGAVALTAGIILYNNYEHKVAAANTVVGYTADGGVVYADGRIVYPNSGNIVVYASNNGSAPCTFIGPGVPCQPAHLYAYFPRGYVPACWPPGHCKQYWKEHPGNGKGNGNGHGHGGGDND
jgi:hypothetical protein